MPRLGPEAARKLLGRIQASRVLEGVGTFSRAESFAVAALWDRGATAVGLAGRMGISRQRATTLLRALAFLGVAAKPRKRWRVDQGQVRLCFFCKRPMAACIYNSRGQPSPYARADKLSVSYSRTHARKHVCGGGPKLMWRKEIEREARASDDNRLEGSNRCHDRPGQKEGGGAVACDPNCRKSLKKPVFPQETEVAT